MLARGPEFKPQHVSKRKKKNVHMLPGPRSGFSFALTVFSLEEASRLEVGVLTEWMDNLSYILELMIAKLQFHLILSESLTKRKMFFQTQ
jgi:hypothetical protein